MITNQAEYIQATLSSKLFEFAYKRIYSSVELGMNGYQYNKHALVKLPIRKLDVYDINNLGDNDIYELYDLDSEEIEYILKVTQSQQNQ